MGHHHLINSILLYLVHRRHRLRNTRHLLREQGRRLLIQCRRLYPHLIRNSSKHRHRHRRRDNSNHSNSNNLRIHQQPTITLIHIELPQLPHHGREWLLAEVPVLLEPGIINKIRMAIIYRPINIHSIINFHRRIWRDIIYMDHRMFHHRLHMGIPLTERLAC